MNKMRSAECGVRKAEAPLERLTERQRSVLAQLAKGAPRRVIAGELGLTIRGVDYHCTALFRVLGVATTVEAVQVWCKGQN